MTPDRSNMWNSVELFALYTDLHGDKLSRRTLIRQLQQTFGSDLLVLSSPGTADIIAFPSCASQTLRLVNDDEDDMESIAVKASKQITQDVINIDMDKGHYNISINKDMIKESSSEEGEEQTNPKINRIPKDSPDIPYDIDIHRSQGPKQPPMPPDEATKADLSFLQEVLTQDNSPEYHGYNTKHSRVQGTLPQAKTKALYFPLIDMKPSDPDTMMTAMARVQELTSETGQNFSVLTCDQQLYRVAVQVLWGHPDKLKDMHLRLGGMHALMSFNGAIGSLMAESGLSSVLSEVFGGVAKMLNGKKFPQNVRALRMMAEEVLRSVIMDGHFQKADDLMRALDQIASQSRTAKLWVEVLVKPVLLMMSYIRAEREGDWLLHLTTFRKMLPYYFAAGHVNYARYGIYYLRSTEKLPPHVQGYFLQGQHVTRHIRGIWNGLWSDQFIESTFMRYGHSVGGIIGITLKPEALKIWALSRHICCKIESDMKNMEEEETNTTKVHLYHKEEAKARVRADTKDRDGLHQKLDVCLHPLDPNTHPGESIVNITSGKIAPPTASVDSAVKIGEAMLEQFEKTWPDFTTPSQAK
ncbi:hypothetical protein JOQ06_013311 [Pogonophryne albipinna]|uniref:Uncharacterized protein n=1 Tax=Pogonophryne albipinna TaxID=1090488 RepID=A0AAD6BIS2_9TELE|nr:hypothetical protein JOQ06_013311 [Pogonophryne albipinna]